MIELLAGDITRLGGTPFESSAIVNAANSQLLAGSGVCGSIFRAAGRELLESACIEVAPCPTGEARITPAFKLAAQGVRYIIHAVGPRYLDYSPREAEILLQSAYVSAVQCALAAKVESVAFPSLSTGIFGFPLERAAQISIEVLQSVDRPDLRIRLVAFDKETEREWSAQLEKLTQDVGE